MKKRGKFSYLQAQKKYSGQFIAREGNRVLAAGKTFKKLMADLQSKGVTYSESIVIGHVPPPNAICIYVTSLS